MCQHKFHTEIKHEEISTAFQSILSENVAIFIKAKVASVLHDAFDATSTMDAAERIRRVVASSTIPFLTSLLIL